MLVLVVITLYLPLLLKLAGGGTTTKTVENPTWESLGQNAVMAAQWEKLDFTPEKAATIIGTRFDYAFNWGAMAFTALIIVGYFVFLFRYSDKQYRDVIAERFDGRRAPESRPHPAPRVAGPARKPVPPRERVRTRGAPTSFIDFESRGIPAMVAVMNWGAWAVATVLALWMGFDLLRTNRSFDESFLLSSEEGEIVDAEIGETAARS